MAGLAAGDYVETLTRPLAEGGSDGANLALQAVSIDSLFRIAPPYDDWIALHPAAGLLDRFDDDPDGDGNVNGVEYYFGTDPGIFSVGVGEVRVNGSTVIFRHPLNVNLAADVAGNYIWSRDLESFHADGAIDSSGTKVEFVPSAPSDGMVEVTATISGPLPSKLFIAIEVTRTAP